MGKLGFATPDLRIEAGDLLLEGTDIGGRECRIERRQHLAGDDVLTFVNLDRFDQRGIERLKHDGRLGGHDLAEGAGDDAVESV